MTELGFEILPGEHPIVPVMIGDEVTAARFAQKLVELGVYAVSFSFPVVPRGTARIGRRCPPPIRGRTSTSPPTGSRRRDALA